MEDLTGKQLGKYRIISPLGEGGMAAVYKAFQHGKERYVALKTLPRHYSNDPQFQERFQQEAQIIAKFQHPHILPVFDYGEEDGYAYLAMPFIQGGVIPALLTPFTKSGKQVDHEKAAGLARFLADKGVHGLFVAGTTGEGMLMTLEERKQLLETVIKAVGDRVDVIAHTGCLDTASTINLTCHAAQAGAKAAGVVAPGFYGYDNMSLALHYRAVAQAAKGLSQQPMA